MSVTKHNDAPKKTRKKGGIIALLCMVLVGIAGFLFVTNPQEEEQFDLTLLENLVELDYQVISVDEVPEVNKFEVVIETEEEPEELVELVKEFKTVIEKEEGKENVQVGTYVYHKDEQAEKEDVTVNAGDATEDYRDYIEVGETITITTPIEMGDLEGEAGITADWTLHTPVDKSNEKYITFDFNEAVKEDTLDQETIFKQLKGIHQVMVKHNDSWTEEVITAIVSEVLGGTYAYVGNYPTTLFLIQQVESN